MLHAGSGLSERRDRTHGGPAPAPSRAATSSCTAQRCPGFPLGAAPRTAAARMGTGKGPGVTSEGRCREAWGRWVLGDLWGAQPQLGSLRRWGCGRAVRCLCQSCALDSVCAGRVFPPRPGAREASAHLQGDLTAAPCRGSFPSRLLEAPATRRDHRHPLSHHRGL